MLITLKRLGAKQENGLRAAPMLNLSRFGAKA